MLDWRSRLEVVAVDLLRGGGLLFGAAREQVAHRLVVHGADEAAAIEPGLGRVPAAAVGDAEESNGRHDEVGGASHHGLPDLLELADDALVGHHRFQFFGLVLLRCGVGCEGNQEAGGQEEKSHGA